MYLYISQQQISIMANSNLHKAKSSQRDEFYTPITVVEQELKHYKDYFKGKVVYLNADDYRESSFFKYFSLQFHQLGLKKLIATCYKKVDVNVFNGEDSRAVKVVYKGTDNENQMPSESDLEVTFLEGDGDFRSEECIEILKESDIVVTNPPFSLFREYIAQLMEYEKQFLVLGNNNAITYKEVFPLFKENKIWLGHQSNKTMEFYMPDTYEKWDRIEEGVKIGKVPAISWFTNLPVKRFEEEIFLFRKYEGNEGNYPTYDNYNAIEVSKVNDIPEDFFGVMGVPITFLGKFNPKQFEIVKFRKGDNEKDLAINGKTPYFRILIKRK